jgi:hypothetical protein
VDVSLESRRAVPVSRINSVKSSCDTFIERSGSRNKDIRVASPTERSGIDSPAFRDISPQSKAKPISLQIGETCKREETCKKRFNAERIANVVFVSSHIPGKVFNCIEKVDVLLSHRCTLAYETFD